MRTINKHVDSINSALRTNDEFRVLRRNRESKTRVISGRWHDSTRETAAMKNDTVFVDKKKNNRLPRIKKEAAKSARGF